MRKSLITFNYLARTSVSWSEFYIIIIGILFTTSVVIEKGSDVLLINGNHTPLLDVFFKGITTLGNGIIFALIVIAALFTRFEYGILAALIALVNGILVSIFKRALFYGLDRPVKYLHDHTLHFVSGVDVHNINTFPSGHTATAFSAALLITQIIRGTWGRVTALLLALLVAYSRIYLLQHFLIDIAAGATIGWFSTYSICRTSKFVPKPEWANRKMELTFWKTRHGAYRRHTIANTDTIINK